MGRSEAKSAVETVMANWPNLTCWGFAEARSESFSEARAQLRSEGLSYFLRAAEWLSHIPRHKTPNLGSYFLKHQAERWTGDYVSNGALIAAAIHLGFKVEPIQGTPNALINVATRTKWPRGYDMDDQSSRGDTAEDGQRIKYDSTMHAFFLKPWLESFPKSHAWKTSPSGFHVPIPTFFGT
jgi:hypothetical protein